MLGQAKWIKQEGSVKNRYRTDRCSTQKRWIGAVATTVTFSVQAKRKLLADQYPLVLINGARLAQEIRAEIANTGLTLVEILQRQSAWYQTNQRAILDDRIAFGVHWGLPIIGLRNQEHQKNSQVSIPNWRNQEPFINDRAVAGTTGLSRSSKIACFSSPVEVETQPVSVCQRLPNHT